MSEIKNYEYDIIYRLSSVVKKNVILSCRNTRKIQHVSLQDFAAYIQYLWEISEGGAVARPTSRYTLRSTMKLLQIFMNSIQTSL